jgi:hypothetical protein
MGAYAADAHRLGARSTLSREMARLSVPALCEHAAHCRSAGASITEPRRKEASLRRTPARDEQKEWDSVSEAARLLAGIDGTRPGELGQPTSHAEEVGWTPEALEMGILELASRRLMQATVVLERLASGRRYMRRVQRELKASAS